MAISVLRKAGAERGVFGLTPWLITRFATGMVHNKHFPMKKIRLTIGEVEAHFLASADAVEQIQTAPHGCRPALHIDTVEIEVQMTMAQSLL
jgi:hypothetical protein